MSVEVVLRPARSTLGESWPLNYGRTMDEKLAKCLLYTKVLTADGMITENERAFLDQAMNRLELTPDQRRRVLDLDGWDEAEAALRSLDGAEKERIVSELLDAASADGRLSPLEVAAVRAISKDLGIDD